MFEKYKTNPSHFITDLEVNNFAFRNYNIPEHGEIKHFQLLTSIVYKLIKNEYNKDYLIFLDQLLFTIFEENAISVIHTVERNTKLNNLLFELDRKYRHLAEFSENNKKRLFYFPGKGILLSNTSLKTYIDILQIYIENKSKDSKSKRKETRKHIKTTPDSRTRRRSRSRSRSISRSRSRSRSINRSTHRSSSINRSRSRSRSRSRTRSKDIN